MNNDRDLGKNYILAMVLMMAILIGYPYFLKWAHPPADQAGTEYSTEEQSPDAQTTPAIAPALSEPEGPFLERAVPPAVVQYENENYKMEFSTLGATIGRLEYKGETHKHKVTNTVFFENQISGPGIFGIRFLDETADLSKTIFKLNRSDKKEGLFEFVYEKPGDYRVIKTFTVSGVSPEIYLLLEVENLSSSPRRFPLELLFKIDYLIYDQITAHNYEALAMTDKVESANLDKAKKGFDVVKDIQWAGVLKKYFVMLVHPDKKALALHAGADDLVLDGALKLEPMEVGPLGKERSEIRVYAGPQRYEMLKEMNEGYEVVLSRGFFGVFKVWMLQALKFSHKVTGNFGWDIILLTLLLKGLFTPLTHISYESMKKMQALQPKLKALQERHKNDPGKLNKEMMALYKRNRVNPMSGCLPMVLQIPVFIAFYQVLNETIELKGAPFMGWINDLSEPDRLFSFPFSIPFLGDSFHLLPLLMLLSMYWQQKLTPQTGATPEQTKMFAFMPLIFGFIFYKMPSGLVLYWFVNNCLSIIHQVFIKRMVIVLHHEDRD